MSNEFVMVPRAELVRLQENMDPHCGAVAWGIVCDLLSNPRINEGQPLGYLDRIPGNDFGFRSIKCSPHAYYQIPVYLHADPGKADHLTEANRLLMDDCDSLRAQLAERDALLRDARKLFHSFTELGGKKVGTLYSHAIHMGHRINAALSASAEPSAPVEIDERADFEVCFDRMVKEQEAGLPKYCVSTMRFGKEVMWEGWQARAALERKP